jgi:large subunit ribosomal protein L13
MRAPTFIRSFSGSPIQRMPGKGVLSGMSTFVASREEALRAASWHLIDADGQVLGRIASAAARLLQGKHKPVYTPFIDTGDHVIVVNAAKVKLTGRKEEQKIYRQHSGYEGGLREQRARIVRERRPQKLIEDAVRGMLPKTRLGEAMYRKLKVYAGPDHPHSAQKPAKLEVV